MGACTITEAEGKSVGVAICGRTHIGMKSYICDEAWPVLLNQRFILKHVAACCRGGIHMGSCYLTSCSAGVKDKRNLDTLHHMAGVLNSLKGPWAVGGDWSCTPEELAQTGWLKIVKGTVVAPQVSACNSRAIDFFVVSEGLSQAAPAAYTIGDGWFYPHSAVRLILRGRARASVVRKLKAPRGFAALLPQGPHNQKVAEEEKQGKKVGQ